MTEGIVQKVFNSFIRKHNDPFLDNRYNVFDIEDAKELQQELIAEIEKKFPEYKDGRNHTAFWNKTVHHVITEIIGDLE